MSASNEVKDQQFESVDFEKLNHRERQALRMFRQLDQQRQMDILRFIEVLLSKR
ncbi:hypothetical protein [Pseudomonas marginalis]|jgi:hypothetical protein|uniref:hypothetical protein n=1 Tax=Pseudomonas marginalis TaxID=298 RepID=UPI00247FE3FF|nr:hypothetical protein [Pseudomonas marginalis]WGT30789.1 hypothetical protein QGQ83_13535 [Pseudomonas marginalis]